MARTIAARWRVSGTLVAQTPLHVGGLGVDVDTDLPLARNGADCYYVPGTSLAGAMRAWCVDIFGEKNTEKLWGYQKKDEGHASWISIEDAVLTESVIVEVRDGVGIDRVWGCAAEHIKYDRAILPRGTELPLVMTIDLAKEDDQTHEMLAALLGALEEGEVRFGAAQTRGLGKMLLKKSATIQKHSFRHNPGDKPRLLDLLRGPLPTEQVQTARRSRPRLIVKISWRPLGPLMVKSGMDGVGVDVLPLVSGRDGKLAPVLPGSSIKGALRSQAERIVRTVLGKPAEPRLEGKQRFLEHTDIPLVEQLFGSPGMVKEKAQTKPAHLGRGALTVEDCYASCTIPYELWQSITQASPDADKNKAKSELRLKLEDPAANLKHWTSAFHVAVDRWTGGAADGLLYSVLEPHGVTWESLQLEIDFKRLPNSEWEGLALLFFVLRDLTEGRLPLGFATHRGMGALAVDAISFVAKECPEPFAQLDGKSLKSPSALPPEIRNPMNQKWQQWLQASKGAAS